MTTEQPPAPSPSDDLAGLKKALAAEREARRLAEKSARDATSKLAEIELDQARGQVAAAKGLTAEQAARLNGSTVEELTVDADKLLEAFKPEKPAPAPSRKPQVAMRGGLDPASESPDDADAIAERIYSR